MTRDVRLGHSLSRPWKNRKKVHKYKYDTSIKTLLGATGMNGLTHMLLRLLSSNAQKRKKNMKIILTLMLLVTNLAKTIWCKIIKKKYWNPGIWVLIWEYSARPIQWVPTQQSLDGFQKSLHSCALNISSLIIGSVNPVMLVFIGKLSLSTIRWVPICHGFSHIYAFCHHFMLKKLATSSKRVKTD